MLAQESPYEYFGASLCVKKPFLIERGLITTVTYDNYVNRGKFKVLRNGRGKGNYALIDFESIQPESLKQQLLQIEPLPSEDLNILTQYIKPDSEAIRYFVNATKPDGSSYKLQEQRILATNAVILNACQSYIIRNSVRLKKYQIWQNLSAAINSLEGHVFKLPSNPAALKIKYEKYLDDSYRSLIHGNEGNDNSRKVNAQIENLILSIYSMKNKPFSKTVLQIYLQFLGGAVDIVDRATGELLDPKDFYKKGEPIVISEATVWNYLNDPKNRKIVDKYRSGSLEFNNNHRPHHHRHAPMYSLSKVSLDDRDLPRKMLDGKRVKAYYAYDVASGCVIGASYSKDKDNKLFLDCIKDMLQFLQINNFGIPMEMEVEHHLVNNFKDDLFKAGVAFPFVRWCNAGNSQEKHAEHFNKAKKYGFEKRYQDGIGRWYAKSEAHRTIVEKVFDSENNNYKEKKHEYNSLVADDREIIVKYNNALHPNQKKFPGQTRMQVLINSMNPNLAHFDNVIWARYVGKRTSTTIRRSQYVTVQHAKYQLPSPQVLSLLATNNFEVEAYYLSEADGSINKVFLYQNEQFIAECQKIETYNTATAEHTEKDRDSYTAQSKYVSEFDALVKSEAKEKITKMVILENNYPTDIIPEVVPVALPAPAKDDYEELLRAYEADDYMTNLAKDQI